LGWGKGIPDMYSQELDEKTRNYIIEKLEANSEYVLSLRASNERGTGPPVYTTVRTQDEPPPEPTPPLIPPVGLKAQILSATSVVLYWTDTTLSKSQYVRDSRYYVVKYTAEKLMKTRYLNITDLNVMIDDLKPNTVYEFSVKLVKGLFAIYVANLNINFKQIRPQREPLEHGCAEFDVGVGPECRP
jgi:neogenin